MASRRRSVSRSKPPRTLPLFPDSLPNLITAGCHPPDRSPHHMTATNHPLLSLSRASSEEHNASRLHLFELMLVRYQGQGDTLGGKRYPPASVCMSSQTDACDWLMSPLMGRDGTPLFPSWEHGLILLTWAPWCKSLSIKTCFNSDNRLANIFDWTLLDFFWLF